jgi:hypothetical protein
VASSPDPTYPAQELHDPVGIRRRLPGRLRRPYNRDTWAASPKSRIAVPLASGLPTGRLSASPRHRRPDEASSRAEDGVPSSLRRLADEHRAERRDNVSRRWAVLSPGGLVSARLRCDVTRGSAHERRVTEGGCPTRGH